MERLVLLRSCHPIAAASPCAAPTADDELHVTIPVASVESIAGTPQTEGLAPLAVDSNRLATSEPIAEDLLGVLPHDAAAAGPSTMVHTVRIPLSELSGRVIIEDVATSALFHPANEVSVVCTLARRGESPTASSASPLFTAYARIDGLQPTHHPDVQTVQHIGLRVVNESTGVCLTLVKAPATTDRGIEGALATEHLRCYHDHIAQWQLQRALTTKNAAVDELIQSDILLSEEIKRQRLAYGCASHGGPSSEDDEVTALRAKVKALELERVKELEAMRRLIAERRAEREAHIESRLREGRVSSSQPLGRPQPAPSSVAGSAAKGSLSRTTPLRNSTPARGSTPQRGGAAASSRPSVSTPMRSTAGSSCGASATGRTTPSRGAAAPQRPTQRSETPPRGLTTDRRSSVGAAPRTPATAGSSSSAANAAAMRRADENLQRLRGGGPATQTPAPTSRLASTSGIRQSPSVGARNASPMPSRGVPPPPADIRASPLRTQPGAASPSAASRRTLAETPTRSATPPKGGLGSSTPARSTPLRTNTQSLIRMARQ